MIPGGTLHGTHTPWDDGQEGIYHMAPRSPTAAEDKAKLQSWQTGPTTKENYQRHSDAAM